jgi:hypothetical protein
MADRKAPSPSGKKPGGSRPPTSKPGTVRPASKAVANRPGGKPPANKKSKSIVNQRTTPWGMIATVAVVVVLAAGVIVYAVTRHGSSSSGNLYAASAYKDATSINGVVFKQEPNHTHVEGLIKYDTSPPTGGNHSQYWADCSGTVYPNPIADENAVHALEHGAVWITYKPGLAASQVATLSALVSGKDRMLMSPYPGLKTNISLQAWGYQLFVDSASDPRIQQFINVLRYNQKTTPEYGASCSQPTFITNPSTPGHPLWTPATTAASAPATSGTTASP